MAKTEIATVQNSALIAESAMPEWLAKGNRGSEEVDSNDLVLPRIGVLQALSPQIKKSDPKFIQGAEQGKVWNTLTGELYGDDGIIFVPVLFRKEWVAFKDRNKGGGFKGSWPYAEAANAEKAVNAMEDAADIELMESHSHIGYVVKGDGSLEQAIISCTKSAIKFSRKLNSLVTMAGVDRFAKAYSVYAIEVSGPKGDYYSFDAKPMGFVTKEVYKEAEDMYMTMKDKKIGTNYDHDDAESSKSAIDEQEF